MVWYEAQGEKIKANYKDGVLKITCLNPKKPKRNGSGLNSITFPLPEFFINAFKNI